MQPGIDSSPYDRRRIVYIIMFVALDALIIAGSYFLALLLRFDFLWSSIDPQYIHGYELLIGPYILCGIVILQAFKLYHSIWRFASMSELVRLVAAWVVDQAAVLAIFFITQIRMPISFWFIGAVFCFVLTCVLRFSLRFFSSLRNYLQRRASPDGTGRIMVIGAGEAGRSLVREMTMSPRLSGRVCCVIDDNPSKKGRLLEGIPIVGGRHDIPRMAEKYGIMQIVFAIPSMGGIARKEILEICQQTSCQVRVVPGIYQLVDGQVTVSKLRKIQIEDLLGRDPRPVSGEDIAAFIRGKVILVTGGGGSIGSELCRQIAQDRPRQLIIFDIYENNVYAIQQELKQTHPELDLVTFIGSVRDAERVRWVLGRYRPQIIFHAAAHKHVPLMEDSPNEAIKNNVMGTYTLAQAAVDYGTRRFVLISTDKAVNPTSIMGASKRLCEMVAQMMNRKAADLQGERHTEFVAVRFGNVLGSNGSVVPLFERQIAAGGPVTVTDKRIIRYFMTIPEAVSLVLQASHYARGGEIFVLDMGNPIKIDDMARNLIRLSGYEPDVDIEIVYTGLRPGEKLFEEMLMSEEGLKETPNRLIHVGEPIEMDDETFERQLRELDKASRAESADIKKLVAGIVPTYHPELGERA